MGRNVGGDTEGAAAVGGPIPAEDRGRAEMYRLLSILMDAPPPQEILDMLSAAEPTDTAFGRLIAQLGDVGGRLGRAGVAGEFADLFVGAPMPKLSPYASHYTENHLFGRALAELRIDLARLGIARRKEATEPEDHIAILCEIMSGLLLGAFERPPLPLPEQARFFRKHLEPWAATFFAELEASEGSNFYMVAGRLGRTFFEVEAEAFRMA